MFCLLQVRATVMTSFALNGLCVNPIVFIAH